MDQKVVRIPISYEQRMRNQFGEGYVPCEVSSRWLYFYNTSTTVADNTLVNVDVMTMDANDKPRKLCELTLSKEEIMRALNQF